MHPDGPTPSRDLDAAAWIAPRLNGRFSTVGCVVPTGFAAYARILHPARGLDGDPVSWAQVAAETGRAVHPLVQWHRLIGTEDYLNGRGGDWSGGPPQTGHLEGPSLDVLLDVLSRHTATPHDCWFGLWEGWGWIDSQPGATATAFAWTGAKPPPEPAPMPPPFSPEVLGWPRVETPGRNFLLLHGPLASARFIGHQVTPDWFIEQSPQLIWPDDRAWCVGTEIDFDSTLVGGTVELAHQLLNDRTLDAWPINPDDSLAADADLINPVP
jgi:hypothetical protein